jgi:hypothetical protein
MRITKDKIKSVPNNEQKLLLYLFDDLSVINCYGPKSLYIDWQDYHNEYSPEWTEPCPDFYGYYTLRDNFNDEKIGVEMTIGDLDMVLCTLYEYIVDE